MAETRDTRITIRMPSALREALEAYAADERRTLADAAVLLLEDALRKAGRLGGKGRERRPRGKASRGHRR